MTNRTRKYLGLGLPAPGMAPVGGATIRKARRAETEFPAP